MLFTIEKQQNFGLRFMFKRKYPFYLTLCAIAKNEGRYLQEWIEYHKMLGVEKFFIYDNESADNTREILQPYIDTNLVEYCYFPGKKMQLKAYANCVRKHKRHTKYLGFLDIDEFIVPIKHKTIPDYLRSLGRFSGVQMNWLVYGSGGAKKREKGFVMERFKDHSFADQKLNRHIKVILNPRLILRFFSAHRPVILGRYIDSNGNITKKRFWDRTPVSNQIRINHYALKSYEEFLEKRSRGRARFDRKRGLDYFDNYDLNDIRNDSIMDKYIVELKKRIK